MKPLTNQPFLDEEYSSASRQILFASDCMQRERYEAAREILRHVLEKINDLTADERLAIYDLLIRCPGERFTQTDCTTVGCLTKNIIEENDEKSSIEEKVAAYGLRGAYRQLSTKQEVDDALRCARVVLRDDCNDDMVRQAAHLLICKYSHDSDEWNESQDAVIASADEFAVTYAMVSAAARHKDPLRAIARLNQTLRCVRHSSYRAKLITAKVQAYATLLLKQEEEYDSSVNEKRIVIVRDMNACAALVHKTGRTPHQWAQCLYHLARVDRVEGRIQKAKMRLASAMQIAEMFLMDNLQEAIKKELHIMQSEE